MRTSITLLLGVSFGSTMGQTIVSGGIFTDATWTLAGSPYHVVDNVVLFDTYTLTIEPGVVVQVDADKTIELRNSRLIAIGTNAQPISFERAGVAKWKGFKLVGNQSWPGYQVQMEHCIGTGATRLLDFDVAYDSYEFIDCEFFDNTTCSWGTIGSFVENAWLFLRCSFHDNQIALGEGYLQTIVDCTFENNGQASVNGYWVIGCTFIGNDLAWTTGHHADGNTFIGNVVAVEGSWAGSGSFTNNVVVNNGTGVRMGPYFNGSSVFANNVICHNTLWNIERFYNLQSNNTADLSGNCFCTDDPVAIEQSIYHAVDDINVGLIVFTPFNTDPGCLNFSLGTPDLSPPEMAVYPNPTADLLTVISDPRWHTPAVLTIFDASGRTVASAPLNGSTMQLDLGALPNGTFQAVLRTDEYVATCRVVVMH